MITKEKFMRYEQVRLSGRYNMLTDWKYVIAAAELTKQEYFEIVTNYSELTKKFKEQ